MNSDHAILVPNPDRPIGRTVQSQQTKALRGEVWLILQTYQAQQLLRGRARTKDRPVIIGLIGFADRLRVIWQAARSDDPYADWWLIQVHDALQVIDDVIEERQARVTQQLAQIRGMSITVGSSVEPSRIRLQFINPYAYRAARSLARFDNLVCSVATAAHIGLLDTDTRHQILQASGRKLRSLFMLPQRYRLLALDRETVRRKAGRSHEAQLAMGELPASILSGEQQSPLTPRKINFPLSQLESTRSSPGLLSQNDNDDQKDGGD